MKLSVIVTVRNEAANIAALLHSLRGQAHLHEVILVDAESRDATVALAKATGDEARLPLRVLVKACSRGGGRNLGVEAATGDAVAFIDGDCTADSGWLAALDAAHAAAMSTPGDVIVAGRTVLTGHPGYTKLHRVELAHHGQDTTWPSCNLLYPRDLFLRVGGFDEAFVTAEDIDLNFRAVDAGARIVHAAEAVVHAKTRHGLAAFLRQAYWNGYGRKQLTLKHGRLWKDYKFTDLLRLQAASVWGLLRLVAGLFGYLAAKFGNAPRPSPAPGAGKPR